jgi:curli biogenesis system outer membrane secretion channel CsgG
MKFVTCILIGLTALGATIVSAQTRVKAGEKPKLAVMPTDAVKLRQTAGSKESVTWDKKRVEHETSAAPLFADESQITAFAEAATQKVVGAFQRINRVTVLDRTAMEKILKEQNFQMSDNADPNAQTQMGKLLGAAFIVSSQIQGVSTNEVKDPNDGSVAGFGGSVDMQVTILDATTGEVIDQSPIKGTTNISGAGEVAAGIVGGLFAKNAKMKEPVPPHEATATAAVMKALDQCGDAIYAWLKKVYPVEGIIFTIDKEKKGEALQVTISCGRNMGVKKKDEFKVFEEQEVEVDGRVVKKTKNIGTLKVNGLEEDGEFASCDVDKGGKDILEKFKNKAKLKVVSRH